MSRQRFTPRDEVATILSDGQVAAAAAMTATLGAAAGARTFLCGFAVTGAGATAASVIEVVTTGLTTQMKFKVVIPAGVTTTTTPLVVDFTVPIPASADNTAITISVPSFGAGNTDAAVSAWGYRV